MSSEMLFFIFAWFRTVFKRLILSVNWLLYSANTISGSTAKWSITPGDSILLMILLKPTITLLSGNTARSLSALLAPFCKGKTIVVSATIFFNCWAASEICQDFTPSIMRSGVSTVDRSSVA